MILHVFNPEHDIALAYNRRHLTMPHAAQELRTNLGWMAAVWASDGDAVLVDDVPYAHKAFARFRGRKHNVVFMESGQLRNVSLEGISPWGWDITLKTALMEAGVDNRLLPSDEALEDMRQLSSRRQTSTALLYLRSGLKELTCGETEYATNISQEQVLLQRHCNVVMKAPWSSSGRGIRYVNDGHPTASAQGFVERVMKKQGGVMVEPYYNKVKDFGMEFHMNKEGWVVYDGLSLFQTVNGVYTGNLLATEEDKMEQLEAYVSPDLLVTIRQRAVVYMTHLLRGKYEGPFGIDMMIVAKDDGQGYLVHPCVEINLRRTMGHVALALSPTSRLEHQGVMNIVHEGNYKLKVSTLYTDCHLI